MDEGPFRVPRQPERRSTSRQEPTPNLFDDDDEQPDFTIKEEPKPVHQLKKTHHASSDDSFFSRFKLPIIILVIIVVAILGWIVWMGSHSTGKTGIDSSKYQAVFFTNGQVYFGKLQTFNDDSMKLTDVYYLKSEESKTDTDSKNPQATAEDQSSNLQLVKLGVEIHGPEDEMIVSKDQMLFYENLKSDSSVVKSIDKYKSAK